MLSSNGNAIVAPSPRNSVRRGICFFVINMSDFSLENVLRLRDHRRRIDRNPTFLERLARDDPLHQRRPAVVVAEYLVEQGAKLDARDMNGWIPWAIAHGFSYSNFYKAQAHTAALLAGYMEERGLSTEDETIPGSVCFDCQTRAGYVQSELERDIRMEAEFAVTHGRA